MCLIARRVALYVVTAIVAITSPSDLLIGFIISAAGWAFGARQLRARDYITSAKIIGEAGSRNRDNGRIVIKLITRGARRASCPPPQPLTCSTTPA
jgi:hypothetical protein